MADNTQIEQAGEVMFDSVYIPAFLKQCSDRNVTFANDDDVVAALQSVLMLKTAEAQSDVNQPTDSVMHKTANVALRQLFGEDVAETEKNAVAAQNVEDTVSRVEFTDEVNAAATLLSELS